MSDYEDLNASNCDHVLGGWGDLDYHENTDELPELFEESDLDNIIDNLNDWD